MRSIGGVKTLLPVLFAVAAAACLLTSLFIPWASLHARENIATPGREAAIELDADFGCRTMDYQARTVVTQNGETTTSVVADNTTPYLEGASGLMDRLGILYHSAKETSFTQTGDGGASVTVTNVFGRVPFWVVGQDVSITITARADNIPNGSYIQIKRAFILAWTDVSESNGTMSYAGRTVLWGAGDSFSEPLDEKLVKTGDEFTITKKVSFDEDYGTAAVFGMMECTVVEAGGLETDMELPYSPDLPKPERMNRIQTVPQGAVAQAALAIAAFPMVVASIAAGGAGAAVVFVRGPSRKLSWLFIAAGVTAILAVPFFINGANTLLGIIDVIRDPLEIHWGALALPLAAGGLLIGAGILSLRIPAPPPAADDERIITMKVKGKSSAK